MYKNNYVSAIIAAAGMSNRMGSRINKQFIAIDGKPILAHTLDKFQKCKYIDEIILVSKEEEIEYCQKEIIKKYKFNKVRKIVKGGRERQDSIYNGLLALDERTNIVISHDGARPFVKIENIVDSIEGVINHKACVIGIPVKDTIKVVDSEDDVFTTPNRATLWAAQTPQAFYRDIIMSSYLKAIEDDYRGTDDSSIVERTGQRVKMIMGSYENIKITTPEDLLLGESLIKDKERIFGKVELLLQTR